MKSETLNITPETVVTIVQALRKITHSLDCQSKLCLKQSGLTTAQLLLLKSISTMSEATTRAIAKSISLSPATVNVMIDRLVSKGLVERERSLKDRRVVHSRLTARGRKALKASPPLLPATVINSLGEMNDTDQNMIVVGLTDLAAMFETPSLSMTAL